MLPASPPKLPNADVQILYRPAEHLSGDFYDFTKLPDGRIGLRLALREREILGALVEEQ